MSDFISYLSTISGNRLKQTAQTSILEINFNASLHICSWDYITTLTSELHPRCREWNSPIKIWNPPIATGEFGSRQNADARNLQCESEEQEAPLWSLTWGRPRRTHIYCAAPEFIIIFYRIQKSCTESEWRTAACCLFSTPIYDTWYQLYISTAYRMWTWGASRLGF